ncbi:hypothetical protein B9Y60_14445 [Stenotrophomonas maltophilia]|nr:hypothetical protein B9Y73_14445 [Stenotrophomonas maltophilia]PJL54560.1 hypothetical protein B9Y60_14445 [Stenotrophomonas maltophilia]
MPLLTPAAVRSIDFMDFSARWVSVTNDPVFISRSMTMEPAVAMRSASRGFQAKRCEGSQVGIGELMGNRSRLQEVEVLLDRPAEAGADKRRWAVVAMQIVEGIQLVERQP